jgi:hypothetical protein
MESRGLMMLRVLINRYNPKAGNALLTFLPEEELQAISKIGILSEDLQPILKHPQNSLNKVHHSWIKPAIDRYPEGLRPALFAALTPEQLSGMKESTDLTLSNPAKSFLLNRLYSDLNLQEHLPIDYLPTTELSPLLSWSKPQLIELIDFLGIHDLAPEVRQIVNRDHLKNIYSCLTPKQQQFLKMCLTKKEKIVSSKLGIDPTKQDCPKLKQILHRHGLSRLGKSLCGQHSDLVWTLSHILDMGRGNMILNEYLPTEIAKITSILKQEVVNAMNFMQGQSPKASQP